MTNLSGKTLFISGASRGIGLAIGLRAARDGANVVVAAKTVEPHPKLPGTIYTAAAEIEAAGGHALAVQCDVRSEDDIARAIAAAVERFGGIDIGVNNAGILRDKMSFNMDESDWDDVIRVHLKGHFAPSHFAAIHWRNRSKGGEEVSGRIINTASEAGLFGNAGQANYGAAKAGIAAMTIVLGRELERYGVTVNAISPRARTRMTEDLFGDMAKVEEGKFDAFGPENVAPLVAFLASPEAADINGQNFVVYGGSVWVMQGWQPAGELKRDSGWTPKELADNKSTLFKTHKSSVPPFGAF